MEHRIGVVRIVITSVLVSVGVVLGGFGVGCGEGSDRTQDGSGQHVRSIDDVIKEHAPRLMAIPGVVGVYQSLKDDSVTCLKVMVRQMTPEVQQQIPGELEGYPVVIEETGEIRPLE
jgi:hypothetical protein